MRVISWSYDLRGNKWVAVGGNVVDTQILIQNQLICSTCAGWQYFMSLEYRTRSEVEKLSFIVILRNYHNLLEMHFLCLTIIFHHHLKKMMSKCIFISSINKRSSKQNVSLQNKTEINLSFQTHLLHVLLLSWSTITTTTSQWTDSQWSFTTE